MLYAQPTFTRGHGFGNRLFPWARARVFAERHGARFVTPCWTRWAVGPWLRGGIARRHYRTQILLTGLFRAREGDVGVLEAVRATRNATVVAEPADLADAVPSTSSNDVVVRFEGYREYFRPLRGRERFLLDELRAITRPRWLALSDRHADVEVVANVRCGRDFARVRPAEGRIDPGDATPLPWFVDAVECVRRAAGRRARVLVVSDGTPSDLAPLLRLPDVELVRPGCAISDLLVLSRARVLLASGSSSFSAWGAFLGGMTVASHPGQPLTTWGLPDPSGAATRVELEPGRPSAGFLAAVAAALGPPR